MRPQRLRDEAHNAPALRIDYKLGVPARFAIYKDCPQSRAVEPAAEGPGNRSTHGGRLAPQVYPKGRLMNADEVLRRDRHCECLKSAA